MGEDEVSGGVMRSETRFVTFPSQRFHGSVRVSFRASEVLMHRRLSSSLFFALAVIVLVALTQTLHADATGVYALTGGTVHPVSGTDIPNGIVVIRDGLIESVGAGISVPPDAAMIDVKGMHVYPGLIDAQTSLGFPSPAPSARGRRGAGTGARPQAQQPTLPQTSAAYMAARNANLTDDDLDAKRATRLTR